MFGVNLPGRTGNGAADASIVTSVTTYPAGSGAGATLGLAYHDVSLTPALVPVVKSLSKPDGTSVNATYLTGPSGIAEQAGMPILPLERDNVAYPNTVLRGVGFRGGAYSNLAGILPLTTVPSTEFSAPRVPFYSGIFYPAQPWRVNFR